MALFFLHEVLVLSTIKKLQQQRFWATYFNRKWTFFMGTDVFHVFAKIFGQIVCIRVRKHGKKKKCDIVKEH